MKTRFEYFNFSKLALLCIDAIALQNLIYAENIDLAWDKYKYHDFYYLYPLIGALLIGDLGVDNLFGSVNSVKPEYTRLSVTAQALFAKYKYTDEDGFNLKYSYLLGEALSKACANAGFPNLPLKLMPKQILQPNNDLALHLLWQIDEVPPYDVTEPPNIFVIRKAKKKALLCALCYNAIV